MQDTFVVLMWGFNPRNRGEIRVSPPVSKSRATDLAIQGSRHCATRVVAYDSLNDKGRQMSDAAERQRQEWGVN